MRPTPFELVRRAFGRRIDSNKFAFRATRQPAIGAARRALGSRKALVRRPLVRVPLALPNARTLLRMAARDGIGPAAVAQMLDVSEDAILAAAEIIRV